MSFLVQICTTTFWMGRDKASQLRGARRSTGWTMRLKLWPRSPLHPPRHGSISPLSRCSSPSTAPSPAATSSTPSTGSSSGCAARRLMLARRTAPLASWLKKARLIGAASRCSPSQRAPALSPPIRAWVRWRTSWTPSSGPRPRRRPVFRPSTASLRTPACSSTGFPELLVGDIWVGVCMA